MNLPFQKNPTGWKGIAGEQTNIQ